MYLEGARHSFGGYPQHVWSVAEYLKSIRSLFRDTHSVSEVYPSVFGRYPQLVTMGLRSVFLKCLWCVSGVFSLYL